LHKKGKNRTTIGRTSEPICPYAATIELGHSAQNSFDPPGLGWSRLSPIDTYPPYEPASKPVRNIRLRTRINAHSLDDKSNDPRRNPMQHVLSCRVAARKRWRKPRSCAGSTSPFTTRKRTSPNRTPTYQGLQPDTGHFDFVPANRVRWLSFLSSALIYMSCKNIPVN